MHADLVQWWIRVSILIVLPVAPHYAEHIWTTLLKEPKSIQYARWPEISQPVDRSTLESGVYMREISKTIRDAEGALRGGIKKKGPTPTKAFDLSKPKSVRIFVATKFPEWQDVCVGIVKDAYDEKTGEVDDKKIRDAATKKGLMKDKRVMPFIHDFKVIDLHPTL
jgi:leucyl-tRNA synthetase